MNEDLNSKPSYADIPAKKEVKTVVKKPAREKKKTLGDKIAETFLASDIESVFDHIIFNVVVPSIKDAIFDSINGGLSMLVYGDKRGRGDKKRSREREYTSYDSYYRSERREDDRRDIAPRKIIREFEFDSYDDAVDAFREAEEVLVETEALSVKDLYTICGYRSEYPTNGLGWTTMNGFEVVKGPHGVAYLKVPRPVRISSGIM